MANNNNYNLEWIRKYSTKEFENEFTYLKDDLGVTLLENKTIFKVWSPLAKHMKVSVYQSGNSENADKLNEFEMVQGEKGTWFCEVDENLENKYYTFTVNFENMENTFCDPYARAVGVNGQRSMVIDLKKTNPMGWEKDTDPNKDLPECESIIYELHTRDFSSDQSSDIKNKGKFLGIVEEGTTVNGD